MLLLIALSLLWWILPGPAVAADGVLSAPQWEGLYEYRGSVNLRWFRVQGAAGYLVQKKVGEKDQFSDLTRVGNPIYDDYAVFPGQMLFYRIIPYDAAGKSGTVSEVRYIKVAQPESEILLPPRWSPIMQMKDGIALAWSHPQAPMVLAYNLYRKKIAGEPFTLITSSQDTTFLDHDVTPKSTYQYALTAISKGLQESDLSETIRITFTPPSIEVRQEHFQKIKSLEEVLTVTEPVKTYGETAYGFISPLDLAYWPDKRYLYVSDTGTGIITVINEKDEVVLRLGGKGDAPWNLENLLGITVDEKGFVYAADSYRGEIVIYKPEGAFHKRLKLYDQVKEYYGKEFQARFPAFRFGLTDLVVAADGSLLVVDNPNGCIYVLDRQEKLVRIIGEKGEDRGQMHYPTFLLMDDQFRLTVSDTLNSRLQVMTILGSAERIIGQKGLGIGQFIRPKGMTRDERGLLYVADSYLNAIQVFDGQGNFLSLLADEKGEPLNLGLPNGLLFLEPDLLLVAEKAACRIQVRKVQLGSKVLFFSQRPAESAGARPAPVRPPTGKAEEGSGKGRERGEEELERIRALSGGGSLTLRSALFVPETSRTLPQFASVMEQISRLVRDPALSLRIEVYTHRPGDIAGSLALANERVQAIRNALPEIGPRMVLIGMGTAGGKVLEDRIDLSVEKTR